MKGPGVARTNTAASRPVNPYTSGELCRGPGQSADQSGRSDFASTPRSARDLRTTSRLIPQEGVIASAAALWLVMVVSRISYVEVLEHGHGSERASAA